jgi:hypothetical protein
MQRSGVSQDITKNKLECRSIANAAERVIRIPQHCKCSGAGNKLKCRSIANAAEQIFHNTSQIIIRMPQHCKCSG